MKSVCGADCTNCGYGKEKGCQGCGAPFEKQCFVEDYIRLGGMENYNAFKKQLIAEFNALDVEGMPEITELSPINGAFVNLAYPMPNRKMFKLLDNREIYLGTQVECEFNDGSEIKYFGLVAGINFLLVSEYDMNCSNPQLVIFKRR